MKPRVYIESTVVSYLTARPSRDVIALARQEVTAQFWAMAGVEFEALTSLLVLEEIAKGDPEAAAKRTAACAGLPQVLIEPAAVVLAKQLVALKAVPVTEPEDAMHIALATLHHLDYIVSWNFVHMVSGSAKYRLQKCLAQLGHVPPLIVNPEEFLQELP